MPSIGVFQPAFSTIAFLQIVISLVYVKETRMGPNTRSVLEGFRGRKHKVQIVCSVMQLVAVVGPMCVSPGSSLVLTSFWVLFFEQVRL